MRLHEFLKWAENVGDREFSSPGIFVFSPSKKYKIERKYKNLEKKPLNNTFIVILTYQSKNSK